jgi:DNA-binding NarL/FixJ family response regulator
MIVQGLLRLLSKERDLEACGRAGTGHEALALARELEPDLAVIDLALPDVDGIELIKNFAARCPGVAILVLSMRDEAVYAPRALRAGAKGYIMKGQRPKKVLEAVRQVLDGEVYLSDKMASTMMRRLVQGDGKQAASPVSALSDRELQVFTMIGRGIGPTRIAQRLHLSVKTIETYRAHLKRKLRLPDAAALRRFAIEWTQSHLPD